MPRRPRVCPAGFCFHVLNRAVARLPLFEKPEDYEAFERVLAEAFEREPLPILAYTVMPNHIHLFLRTPQANLFARHAALSLQLRELVQPAAAPSRAALSRTF